VKFVIRDRDASRTSAFDEVFRAAGDPGRPASPSGVPSL